MLFLDCRFKLLLFCRHNSNLLQSPLQFPLRRSQLHELREGFLSSSSLIQSVFLDIAQLHLIEVSVAIPEVLQDCDLKHFHFSHRNLFDFEILLLRSPL